MADTNDIRKEIEADQKEQHSAEAKKEAEKKGWFQSLGLWAKIGLGTAAAGLATGAAWLLKTLISGGNDDEEDETEEPALLEEGPQDE